MTLSNGESIILPIAEKKLEIIIDKDLPIIISAGQTINLSCNVAIDSEPVDSEVCVSYNGNIKAKYTGDPQIPGYGIITITATEEVDEYSNVIIMASDGVRSVLKCLSFENGVLDIVGDNEISFPAEGGELALKYLTNIDPIKYSTYMSNAYMAGFAPMTKSVTERSETVHIYPNEYEGQRECEIVIAEDCENGHQIKWKIKQAPSKRYLEITDNLMVLYNSLDGENWISNKNWGTNEPWESWYGIMANTVEISPGYYVPEGVWSIGLDHNNLCGQIPENIGELFPNLESLSLRGNSKLTGTLPESIGSWTKLHSLDCGMCGLSGTIPSTLGDCINLEYLRLDYNQFSGKIPSEIAKCNNLRELNVEHNQFEGAIPEEFYHYSTLNVRFDYNKFSSLPENIDQFKWMEYLSFAHNSISSIPEAVYSMNWLKVIDLSHNALEMEFPAKLCNMSNLAGIDLSSNKIYGNIPEEIGNMTSLSSLIMSQTYLSGQIPDGLYNLHNLERLDLSHSDFGADGNAFDSAYLSNYQGLSCNISSQIGNLAKLTYLDLSCNSISGEIPEELCLCSNLEQVHLRDNYITGDIPENIGVLKKLDYMDLSFNKMSGEIPDVLFSLTKLRNLLLQGGGSVINPDALGRMRTERNNRFTGELPSAIGSLTNLEQFYLTDTYMTGTLPDEMLTLPNLTDILLFNNRFSGILPSSVRSAKWWKDEGILLQQDGYGLSVSEN